MTSLSIYQCFYVCMCAHPSPLYQVPLRPCLYLYVSYWVQHQDPLCDVSSSQSIQYYFPVIHTFTISFCPSLQLAKWWWRICWNLRRSRKPLMPLQVCNHHRDDLFSAKLCYRTLCPHMHYILNSHWQYVKTNQPTAIEFLQMSTGCCESSHQGCWMAQSVPVVFFLL